MEIKIIQTDGKDLSGISEKLGLREKMDQGEVVKTVTDIIENVKNNGARAVCEYTALLDNATLSAEQLRVTKEEIDSALTNTSEKMLDIIRRAKDNIYAFHEAQVTPEVFLDKGNGASVSMLVRPLETVGVYVPGGTAPLPSSVLMNIIPAKAAGVPRIIMCTPPRPNGSVDPVILSAAAIAGANEIYKVGGAQAIAAMAYGAGVIPAADKICGPGNIYVNTAKRLLYGVVDIDIFAGPSEILIIASAGANPSYLATDLLSQAEHDKLASAILITDDLGLAEKVALQVSQRAKKLPRKEIIEQSLRDYCAIIVVPNLEVAVDFSNELAPEHLEICTENPDSIVKKIKNAGAIFVGNYSPESLGDYFAGPNHVLPTSGTARFFSPLNTADFRKKINVISYTREALRECYRDVSEFACAEQLQAHSESVLARFDEDEFKPD